VGLGLQGRSSRLAAARHISRSRLGSHAAVSWRRVEAVWGRELEHIRLLILVEAPRRGQKIHHFDFVLHLVGERQASSVNAAGLFEPKSSPGKPKPGGDRIRTKLADHLELSGSRSAAPLRATWLNLWDSVLRPARFPRRRFPVSKRSAAFTLLA